MTFDDAVSQISLDGRMPQLRTAKIGTIPETLNPLQPTVQDEVGRRLPRWVPQWLTALILDRIDLIALLHGMAEAMHDAGLPVPDPIDGEGVRSYLWRTIKDAEPHLETISDAWIRRVVERTKLPWWVPTYFVVRVADALIPDLGYRALRKALS